MKKILVLLAFLLIPVSALAQGSPPLCVSEVDGSPSKCGIVRIKVTNGTLTISGTTATIVTGGGGGGGGTPGGSGSEIQYRAGASTFGAVTGSSVSGANVALAGTITQTSASATAFESGPNGGTNPVFRLVNSTASAATGLSITGNAAGSGVYIDTLSSGASEPLLVASKGSASSVYLGQFNTSTAIANFRSGVVAGGDQVRFYSNTSLGALWRGTAFVVSSGTGYLISDTSDPTTFNSDIGIVRGGVNVLRVNNGLAGGSSPATGAGGLLIGSSTDTGAANTLTVARSGIGTTSTDGVTLVNNTAAAAGAQQYSPRLRLTGQGWKTNATAASQTVDWIVENVPVQGSANPTTYLGLSSQVNGGGYTSRFRFGSDSNFYWNNGSGFEGYLGPDGSDVYTSLLTNAAAPALRFRGNNGVAALTFLVGSSGQFGFKSTTFTSGAPADSVDTGVARAAVGVIRATNGSTGAGGILIGSSSATGTAGSLVVASANADSLTVGPNGLTNPILQVVGNVASAATGLSITGNAAGSGVTLTALSSGSNESITLTPKGTGQVLGPSGAATAPGYAFSSSASTGLSFAATGLQFSASGTRSMAMYASSLYFSSSFILNWSNGADTTGGVADLLLRRAAAANLALGAADAAAPVAQTLSVQNVVGGTSNTAGANWTLAASRGTGTGAGGDFIVQTAPAGGSGTTQNALAAAFTVKGNGAVELKTVTFANLPTVANAYLIYCSDCTIASPCASGGGGALAKGIAGAWVCN